MLTFKPVNQGKLDPEWTVGKTHVLKLTFLNALPLGRHRISIASIDRRSNIIKSCESGSLASVWNHTIHFHQVTKCTVCYSDEIEVEAGLITIPVWIFAHFFYCHRQ